MCLRACKTLFCTLQGKKTAVNNIYTHIESVRGSTNSTPDSTHGARSHVYKEHACSASAGSAIHLFILRFCLHCVLVHACRGYVSLDDVPVAANYTQSLDLVGGPTEGTVLWPRECLIPLLTWPCLLTSNEENTLKAASTGRSHFSQAFGIFGCY